MVELSQDILKKINSHTWVNWLERPYPVFMPSLAWHGVDNKTVKKVGLSGFGFSAMIYQYPFCYISQELIDKNYKILTTYLAKNRLNTITKKCEKIHQKNLKDLSMILKSKKSPLEKLVFLRERTALYFPFIWLTQSMEKYFDEQVAIKLKTEHIQDPENFIAQISFPKKKNSYAIMLDQLQKGVSLKNIQRSYGWVKSRDGFSEFYTLDELRQIKKNIVKEKKHVRHVPKSWKYLATELQELLYFRTLRSDAYYEFIGKARPLLFELATFMNISFQELKEYNALSILNGKPQRIENPYTFVYIDGYEIACKELFIKDTISTQSTRVQGKTAYIGQITGVAKIVLHPSDVAKVEKNDILVTQMTLPSFISAMQKASAFVTDEGSITCHAAIMAREMKKPCVIGTKIATKVFKDGDMIEVDADKGIVKKI